MTLKDFRRKWYMMKDHYLGYPRFLGGTEFFPAIDPSKIPQMEEDGKDFFGREPYMHAHKVLQYDIMNRRILVEGMDDFVHYNDLPCAHCHKEIPDNGHDPCMANLPGVMYACCGHGREEGYIFFESGNIIRGYFTEVSKGTPTPLPDKIKYWKGNVVSFVREQIFRQKDSDTL